MTEKEKMLAGEPYYPGDEELCADRDRAKAICEEYNRTPRTEWDTRDRLLRSLLGGCKGEPYAESAVWFDYGYNTFVGENFYANHGCVFLDCNRIIFGDNVLVGPQCGFYTATHPLDAAERAKGFEFAKSITVGNNVWFGGGVYVLPGVTIGDNCVIGAGSVVSHDIPANCVAAGNPAKVIRRL